jgi:stage II sporulation protein D
VKTYIKTIAIIFIFAALLPLISLFFTDNRETSADSEDKQNAALQSEFEETAAAPLFAESADQPSVAGASASADGVAAIPKETPPLIYYGDYEEIQMYDIHKGKVMSLPLEDYVTGAVLHEMPYTFEAEALKAQAVAARTYAVRKMLENRENPQTNIGGADVSNDFVTFQGYYSEAEAKAFYGDFYKTAYDKIRQAVNDTVGLIVVSGDEPIVAAFHSMSSGMTEYSGNIWQTQLPYLVPVISNEDTEDVPLETVYEFTETEVSARLTAEIDGISLPISPQNWFSIEEVSESGTVMIISVGNKLISGEDFRDIFTLRSAVFECEYVPAEGIFRVITKGYGHGVGMSQYGANGMAKSGSSFEEIVLHYYTGTQIAKIESV